MSDKRRHRSSVDLTKGDPLRIILSFSLPLFLSNLFLQFYNLTDTAIIGHALGDTALSAIGSVSIIYNILTSLVFGLTNGFSVIISNRFGAGDPKGLKKAVGNSLLLGFSLVILITLLTYLTLDPVMNYLGVPEDIFREARSYIVIIILTLPITFAYNICASFLRAIGNSVAPLVILVCSSVINVGLDLLLVYVFNRGLAGAATATAVSQFISAAVCFGYILSRISELHIGKNDMKPDGRLMSNLFASGISFAMMFTVVNIGTFFLQRSINGLGNDVIAAHTTARKIDSFCMMPVSTLASTMATFAGQNHGAGRHDRIIEGIKKAILASFILIVFLIVFIFVFGDEVSYLISGSENDVIIGLSHKYLKWNLPFFFVLSILCVGRSTLQGLGAKLSPIIASIMEMGMKIIMAEFLVSIFGYNGIIIVEPLTWVCCAILITIVFLRNRYIRSELVPSRDP